jgi:signal transduction histidine kinase
VVRRTTHRHAYRRALAAVSAVVVLGSGLSFGASAGWRAVLGEEVGVRFDQAEEQDAHAVRRELERYESALVAARALLSSGDTSAQDFAAFADALDLRGRYPSLQAVNWTAVVQEGDLDAYVAERRADDAPAFTVFGAGAGARGREHRVITYVAPLAGNEPALGFDTATRQASRGAQDRSRDTGLPALSERLVLVQDAADPEPGFALTLAVYRTGAPVGTVEERRAALVGWVNATFRGADFLREVLRSTRGETAVSLYAGPAVRAEDLIATEPPDLEERDLTEDGPTGVVHVDAAGTPWTLHVRAIGGAHSGSAEPRLVLVGGLGITTLLAALMWSRGTAEVRAWRLVDRVTARLAEANGALEGANAALEERSRQVASYAAVQQGFVASASHELRTPLTSILGYLEIVLEGVEEGTSGLTRDELACLQVVQRNSNRLLELVGDLLTVSQVEDGSLPLAPAHVAVADLLPRLAELFGPPCARRGLELVVERRVDGLGVFADRGRLEQVLVNLVANAVKFTPPGGQVRLAAAAATDGGRPAVAFAVTDTGLGIAPEDLPRVFDRFFRTAESMEQAVPGTGLGLPIARAIVEASGGRIDVESQVGHGTTFTVVVPASPAVHLAAHTAQVAARTAEGLLETPTGA